MLEKLERLQSILRKMDSVLVAYSGGTDSALVAKVAYDILRDKSVAVTALSPSYPSYEVEAAKRVALEIGIRHLMVETRELESEEYRANRGDRCYFCKSELYTILRPKADELGLKEVVNGTNCDDLKEIRPGNRAAQEQAIRSPLVEAGLSKAEVRSLSLHLGLSTAEKPALACLSSRFPVGAEVTPERLARIDRVESGLCELGFRQFRVRFHDPIARIEIGEAEMERLADASLREKIVGLCRENGFIYATLDLEGYRTGSTSRLRRL